MNNCRKEKLNNFLYLAIIFWYSFFTPLNKKYSKYYYDNDVLTLPFPSISWCMVINLICKITYFLKILNKNHHLTSSTNQITYLVNLTFLMQQHWVNIRKIELSCKTITICIYAHFFIFAHMKILIITMNKINVITNLI